MTLPVRDDVPLAPLTTLELGGHARHFVEAADDDAVVEALRWAEARGLPALILGGGSNVVIADRGWDGLVDPRRDARAPLRRRAAATVTLTAAAGEPWDDVVADTVARDLAGLECLSGIPGLVGATPIQNVGAYGQEVADTIRVGDGRSSAPAGACTSCAPAACAFAYRDSAFKHDPDRFVVLAVTFALRPGGAPDAPLPRARRGARDGGGARRRWRGARRTVLALRRKKSMVIVRRRSQPAQRRIVLHQPDRARGRGGRRRRARGRAGASPRPARCRAGRRPAGRVKLSAGWLIERAGIRKGQRRGAVGRFDRPRARAGPPGRRHRPRALLELAREVRDAVHARFAMTLLPEPTMIGVAWPPPRI